MPNTPTGPGLAALAALATWGCSGRVVQLSSPAPNAPTEDSGVDDAACAAYASDADLARPVVSFAADLLPLFLQSCGLSASCHSHDDFVAPSPRPWGAPLVYLGCVRNDPTALPCDTPNSGPDVYRALVGLPDGGPEAGPEQPVEIASMPFVTPGNPARSYLMHKLDGDLCTLSCIPANPLIVGVEGMAPWCGGQEPYHEGPLSQPSRDLVRRWIAQGARNN
jgi:hypothetical protein